jgi:predicted ribosome quality control (RQC) complex YloA/Tae2 family protein
VQDALDLLDAFRKSTAEGGAAPPGDILLPGALVEALEDAVSRARSRADRLQEELDTLDDPDRLQAWGDLLLARFSQIRGGAETVELEGFDGAPVRIAVDPTLSPDGNARRFYDRAGRLRRARDELPARIRAAGDELGRLEDLRERVSRGEAERSEVEAVVSLETRGRSADGPTLPYRRFRSSGGLEIRVGRGAARNDQLTFHHSRPDDVWLHARHASGAHVILRWDREDAPPARDLEEAAVLAALHSRARTSGSVPVDWTRRKHVRKPRKAPPGAVVPDRVGTVFVTPDENLGERLRDD